MKLEAIIERRCIMGGTLETLHRQIVPGQGMLCIFLNQTMFQRPVAQKVCALIIVPDLLLKLLRTIKAYILTHTNNVQQRTENKPLA